MSSEEQFSIERRILRAMRKTLGNVVKDVTPSNPALKSPLSPSTIEDIRACFDLISAREKELLAEAGIDNRDKPRFIDESGRENVVSLEGLKSSRAGLEDPS